MEGWKDGRVGCQRSAHEQWASLADSLEEGVRSGGAVKWCWSTGRQRLRGTVARTVAL
jgi:hypothetical protein